MIYATSSPFWIEYSLLNVCNENTVPGILIKITIASKLFKQPSQIINHGKKVIICCKYNDQTTVSLDCVHIRNDIILDIVLIPTCVIQVRKWSTKLLLTRLIIFEELKLWYMIRYIHFIPIFQLHLPHNLSKFRIDEQMQWKYLCIMTLDGMLSVFCTLQFI